MVPCSEYETTDAASCFFFFLFPFAVVLCISKKLEDEVFPLVSVRVQWADRHLYQDAVTCDMKTELFLAHVTQRTDLIDLPTQTWIRY